MGVVSSCGCDYLVWVLFCRQNQYMGFGVSGDASATFMVGADVSIAWLDNRDGRPNAVDYFITERSQVHRRVVGT